MPNSTASCIQRLASILAGLMLGVVFIGSGGAQSQGPVLNSPRAPSPGDVRSVKFNEQTITFVYSGKEGSLNCWSVKSSNGNAGRDCRTVEGNLVSRQGAVWIPIEFRPHLGMFAFPMFVGKQWEHSYTSQNGVEGTRNVTRKASVVSYEKLTVAAGTFDVFKIQATISWWGGNLQDAAGSASGMLGANQWGGAARQQTYYYSEKVGLVKFDGGFERLELLTSSVQ